MAKKLSKLAKVNESITINRYDNGFMDFGYFAFTIYLMSFFEKAKE